MRNSGLALALGLIAGAAGLDAHAATAPAVIEQQYADILQLPSTEAVQKELAQLFATDPDHPAVQPALDRMVQVAQLLVPPPAPVSATDAGATDAGGADAGGGGGGGGSQRDPENVSAVGPY